MVPDPMSPKLVAVDPFSGCLTRLVVEHTHTHTQPARSGVQTLLQCEQCSRVVMYVCERYGVCCKHWVSQDHTHTNTHWLRQQAPGPGSWRGDMSH